MPKKSTGDISNQVYPWPAIELSNSDFLIKSSFCWFFKQLCNGSKRSVKTYP